MGVALTKDSIDLGIVVTDIEASLKFYRDLLGFTPAGDGPMPGGSHMWRLMCGTTTIKLLTFDPTPTERPAKGPIGPNRRLIAACLTATLVALPGIAAAAWMSTDRIVACARSLRRNTPYNWPG